MILNRYLPILEFLCIQKSWHVLDNKALSMTEDSLDFNNENRQEIYLIFIC